MTNFPNEPRSSVAELQRASLTICSYEFDAGAEGICTGRLVRALLDAGWRITLFTSQEADTSFRHQALKTIVVPAPQLPWKFSGLIARLIRAPQANYLWCRKIAALHREAGQPALVYGRSMPITSLEAARRLAQACRARLWVHLSDPFPDPWLEPGCSLYRRMEAYARRLAGLAEVTTFTTEPGRALQQRYAGADLSARSFVLPHISPEATRLPKRGPGPVTFAYIGSFYSKRRPDVLLEGFRRHLKAHPDSRFRFVGADPSVVMPVAEALDVARSIEMVGRVKDVLPQMAAADVLVASDSGEGEPVFLSTKLIEYLMVDRPVLLVSPAASPGTQLLKRFPSTTRVAPCQDPEAVGVGMTELAGGSYPAAEFERRFAGMEEFSSRSVAALFTREAKRRAPV
jgi:glycosyltransferase involved in cell wall biosynthesis